MDVNDDRVFYCEAFHVITYAMGSNCLQDSLFTNSVNLNVKRIQI